MSYVELHCHSNFSFLDGASSPEELVEQAVALGLPALALTDHQGLYGAVKFANACRELGLGPIYGAEVTVLLPPRFESAGSPAGQTVAPGQVAEPDQATLAGKPSGASKAAPGAARPGATAGSPERAHLILLVENNAGWANLCRLLSRAGLAGTKHDRPVPASLLEEHTEGLLCLTGCERHGILSGPARRGEREVTLARARWLKRLFGGDRCYVELQRHFDVGDRRLNATLLALARYVGLPIVATNNVHYATARRYQLQHVLTCIREHTSLDSAAGLLYPTPHRCLKGPDEMRSLFADLPQAVANSARIAERCQFELDFQHARLPTFPVPAGETAFSHLLELCCAGLRRKYDPVTPAAASQLTKELGVIERCGLADYFLIVHDIVRFARQRGILCQGRGSAAGSIVAYVLDITPVDPLAHNLLFERFLAEGSHTMPDIDVDFAADRREEVIQYVYQRYGADHTAMVATVITFQARSAVQDVGKALGFPADLLDRIRGALHTRAAAGIAPDLAEVAEFAPKMAHLPWQHLIDLCAQIDGYPRHLSIHVGGMIVTGAPLCEIVPLEPATMPARVVVQWDKDDVEDAGLIKIDLLSLGTLAFVAESLALIQEQGGPSLDLTTVPGDDADVWRMLQAGDAIGCFQVESRAQMNLLPRLRPSNMADLAIEVALIRPGPIEGGMTRAYLARRDGDEPVRYWHPSLEPILAETLGVLVFQEQVLRVAMAIAGFDGAQADGLRRAMGRKRSHQAMERWRSDFVAGAAIRGIDAATAHDIFDKLMGFASYGFCKSHAAAFARLSYVTAWLKWHYPAEFYCGLLNAQPMGFYSIAVIVEDARRHGIAVLPLDINRSHARWTIEAGGLRIPLDRLQGLSREAALHMVSLRGNRPFADLWDFVQRVRPPRATAERLIRAGAFDFTGQPRRQLLWDLGEMDWQPNELAIPPVVLPAPLPPTTEAERTATDYALLGLPQGEHLMALYRPQLANLEAITSAQFAALANGERARVAGRLEVLQRPPPAKGIAFASIEDEYGLVNLLFYPDVYERCRQTLRTSPVILAEGHVQHDRGASHLIVTQVVPLVLDGWSGDDGGVSIDDLPPPAKVYR